MQKMTDTVTISRETLERVREVLKKSIALAERETSRYPYDKYAIGVRYDAKEAISLLAQAEGKV